MTFAARTHAGAQGAQVQPLDEISVIDASYDYATAGYIVYSNGTIGKYTILYGLEYVQDWVIPTTAGGSNYEVAAFLVSGVTPTGSAVDTWLSVGTDQSWYLSASGSGNSASCQLGVEIRETGTATVLASALITIGTLAI